ncbi:hypothetical protein ACIA03_04885 [Nocardioides sp. NPDC051685]|uniref:hypothetical protein n=1 Tax=Nocardioides sp. NPDC051685 TaxID=3364334 RepID=UPI0037A779ED
MKHVRKAVALALASAATVVAIGAFGNATTVSADSSWGITATDDSSWGVGRR